ncbi:hypothetical protein L6452_11232 [Arctium lappa]|uniref:Uncharacterized protein n=1 Tax=Arctium lappa TaxID=4217 RepID=A0ACB9DPM9_ARCLA|nr:hypothetical protein L6452_11232 [Arctium lappa]
MTNHHKKIGEPGAPDSRRLQEANKTSGPTNLLLRLDKHSRPRPSSTASTRSHGITNNSHYRGCPKLQQSKDASKSTTTSNFCTIAPASSISAKTVTTIINSN